MTSPDSNFVVLTDQRARSRGRAFTLLEMLLVLSILVAITAVTIPVVGRMYDTHRIQQAAMEVRTTLSAARLRAVDGGVLSQGMLAKITFISPRCFSLST